MRYVIWHSPRVGSTLLCDLLAKTGKAGFARGIDTATLWVGWGELLKENTYEKIEGFFEKQRTPNGIEGAKTSFSYWQEIAKYCGGPAVPLKCLRRFDRHIWLRRRSKIRQAISWAIAHQTGAFNTRWSDEYGIKQEPIYDPDQITWYISLISAEEIRVREWLKYLGAEYIILYYEDFKDNHKIGLQICMEHIGIANYEYTKSDIVKQGNNINEEWLERYYKDTGVGRFEL